jgi:hypothetical protein
MGGPWSFMESYKQSMGMRERAYYILHISDQISVFPIYIIPYNIGYTREEGGKAEGFQYYTNS